MNTGGHHLGHLDASLLGSSGTILLPRSSVSNKGAAHRARRGLRLSASPDNTPPRARGNARRWALLAGGHASADRQLWVQRWSNAWLCLGFAASPVLPSPRAVDLRKHSRGDVRHRFDSVVLDVDTAQDLRPGHVAVFPHDDVARVPSQTRRRETRAHTTSDLRARKQLALTRSDNHQIRVTEQIVELRPRCRQPRVGVAD